MRKIGTFAGSCFLFVSLVIGSQIGYSQTSNTWSAAGQMTQARTGAAAVLLSDGKLLITGGSDSTGTPSASTEIFDLATGQFEAAPPMNVARAYHAAITLETGDVLVTGGVTAGGGYSDSAEIFSAQTGTWILLDASLGGGVAKHAMATLPDRNIVIIGGENTSGPVLNLLLFKLSDQTIFPVGTLLTGRSDAAAATTPDGRVLIAGGTDINGAVLGSTEIFTYNPDTMSGTIASGPNLTYPRTNATATATYDGVAVIGGTSGSADLGSAEIFSQWTNAFRVVNGAAPRRSHFAALLPNNGCILAMGGTGGTAVDLLQPWGNNLAGSFIAGAPSGADHAGGFAAPGVGLGTLFAAGGDGSFASTAELYRFPTISTDQSDYAPGTPVVMTGEGFQPNETVKLYLREYVNQMLVDPPDYSAIADASGNFIFTGYAPTPSDLGARYHLTASGTTSGLQAQTIFTDNYPKNKLTIAVSPAGGTPVANNVVAGSGSGASDYIPACNITAGCINSAIINNGLTVYVTATPGTGRLFSSWTVSGAPSGSTCATGFTGNPCTLANGNGSNTTTVTANFVLTTALTATLMPGNKVYDGNTIEPESNMSCTLTGVHASDTVTCAASNGSFASSNAGSGINVTATVTLGGSDAAKYTLGAAGTTVSSTSANATASITQIAATISVTPYSVTYDGSAHSAVGTATGLNGLDLKAGLNLTGTAHTAAGTYPGDSWTFHDSGGNYGDASGTVNDAIGKATATVTVMPYIVTYDGQSHTATVASITGVNSESGATVGTVDMSNTTHKNAATYGSDYWTFTGTANYNDIAATAISDTINKASAAVIVTPYIVTYDGQSHSATVASITGVHGEIGPAVGTVTLNSTHTNAGIYSSDSWSFTGTANYNNIAATAITDTINKANATVNVTPYSVTYDGQSHTATVASITGVHGEIGAAVGAVTLNATHINAGTYSDSWSFTGTANYNDIAATTISDAINRANATVNVTPYTVTYDGQSHTATVASITGVNSETGATVGAVTLNSTHTNAGVYSSDSWSFTGTANYNNITSAAITDTILKADPVASVSGYNVTYDGNSHTAVGTVRGVQQEALAGLDLSGTVHTTAGTYTDSWTFTDTTGNYNNTNGMVTDTINKANATVNVTPYSVTYDGAAHTASGSASGVKSEDLSSLLSLTSTTHTNAGDYPADAWSFAGNVNYNSATGTAHDQISKATPSVSVSGYTVTYDGTAHTATGEVSGVKGESLGGLDLITTTHTNANSYSDSWTFTDSTGNYNNASGNVNDVISKANATISVTPYNVTYDGSSHTATGSVSGVGGAPLTGLDLSGTAHTNAGTYTDGWVFTDSTGNYNNASGTASDTISKANATISVMPYKVTYDSSAHTATGSATGISGAALSGLDLSATMHTGAGTYTDNWTFTDTTGNYNNTGGVLSDLILQASATITVTGYNVTYDGSPHTAIGSATGVGGIDLGADLNLTGTTHTNAGTYSTDAWTFHDPNNNYVDAGGTASDLINKANQAALMLNAASPLTYNQGETLSASGGTTNLAPIYNLLSGTCILAGNTLTANNGTGSCVLTATMPGNNNYNDVTSNQVTVTLTKANQSTLTLNAPSTLMYGSTQSLSTNGGTTGAGPTYNLVPGLCSVSGNQLQANSGTGSCILTATMPGNSDYNDVTSSQVTVTLTKASVSVAFNNVGPFVFDGLQHAPSYVINGVNHELLTSSATLSYTGTSGTTYSSSAAPSNPGSYLETIAFAGNNNYKMLTPSASQSFAINYGFSGLGAPYAPPPTTFNVTRTMPLIWQYTNASGAAVSSAGANPQVQISGPYVCGGTDTANDITVNSAGANGYQYTSTTNTWQFNWQVKGNAPGCYNIYIVSGQTGQMSGPFPIEVVSH